MYLGLAWGRKQGKSANDQHLGGAIEEKGHPPKGNKRRGFMDEGWQIDKEPMGAGGRGAQARKDFSTT